MPLSRNGTHIAHGPRSTAIVVLLFLTVACSVSEPRDRSGVGDAAGPYERAVTGGDATNGIGSEEQGTSGASEAGLGSEGSAAVPGQDGDVAPGGEAPARAGQAGSGGNGNGSGSGNGDGNEARGEAAAPGRPAVGVAKDSITVSIIAGYSGALGQVVTQVVESGYGTWADDVNANGGIHGRKVIWKKVDHRETTDGGVAACKDVQSNGSFTAVVAEGLDAATSAAGCLDKAGFSTLATAPYLQTGWRRTYLFEDFKSNGYSLADMATKRLKDGGRKFGVIYLKAHDTEALKDGFLERLKASNGDVVSIEAVDENQSSFVSQVSRMRNAGTEVVVIVTTAEVVGILRDIKAINWTPHRVLGGAWPNLDEFSQAARDLAQGAFGVRGSATVDSPAYEAFMAKARKYGRDRYANATSMKAYGQGLLLGEALRRAGASPNKESYNGAIQTMRDFDTQIYPPITWSASRLAGIDGAFPAECCYSNYTWKGLGPAMNSR